MWFFHGSVVASFALHPISFSICMTCAHIFAFFMYICCFIVRFFFFVLVDGCIKLWWMDRYRFLWLFDGASINFAYDIHITWKICVFIWIYLNRFTYKPNWHCVLLLRKAGELWTYWIGYGSIDPNFDLNFSLVF